MIEDQECMTMNILKKGKGELFTDPDPDHARRFFQKKSRKMVNKAMRLSKAIETFVHDGDYLATGRFGANRAPIAACHEILRQGRKHMGFCGHTTTHDFEILCKRMRVISINPGYSMKDAQDNCGFELLRAPKITETEPPTEVELRILREEVDPHQ